MHGQLLLKKLSYILKEHIYTTAKLYWPFAEVSDYKFTKKTDLSQDVNEGCMNYWNESPRSKLRGI
jgi:hypothetical protein